MSFLYYIFIPISVSVIVPLSFVLLRKKIVLREKEMNPTRFVMKASKGFAYMILYMIVFMIFTIIIMDIEGLSTLGMNMIFLLILFWLGYVFVQSLRQKLAVYDTYIEYTPIIGTSKKVEYKGIKYIVEKKLSRGFVKYEVWNDRLLFKFSNQATGSNLLIKVLFEKGVVQK